MRTECGVDIKVFRRVDQSDINLKEAAEEKLRKDKTCNIIVPVFIYDRFLPVDSIPAPLYSKQTDRPQVAFDEADEG